MDILLTQQLLFLRGVSCHSIRVVCSNSVSKATLLPCVNHSSSTVAFDRRTSAPQYVRATSSGSDYAFIDHEVDEISDPHNQGRG